MNCTLLLLITDIVLKKFARKVLNENIAGRSDSGADAIQLLERSLEATDLRIAHDHSVQRQSVRFWNMGSRGAVLQHSLCVSKIPLCESSAGLERECVRTRGEESGTRRVTLV